MDADTLGRLRPVSNKSDAIRDALSELQRERGASVQRANAARQRRTTALFTGSDYEIGEADRTLRDAALDAEKLDVMEPTLLEQLALAERIEAQGHAEVAEATAAAQTAVQDYALALPGYAKHASAVAKITHLGEVAAQAVQHAHTLAQKHHVVRPQLDLPGMVTGAPSGHAIPLAALVRLPAPDGNGLLVGTWGPEHQPVPAFRYAP